MHDALVATNQSLSKNGTSAREPMWKRFKQRLGDAALLLVGVGAPLALPIALVVTSDGLAAEISGGLLGLMFYSFGVVLMGYVFLWWITAALLVLGTVFLVVTAALLVMGAAKAILGY